MELAAVIVLATGRLPDAGLPAVDPGTGAMRRPCLGWVGVVMREREGEASEGRTDGKGHPGGGGGQRRRRRLGSNTQRRRQTEGREGGHGGWVSHSPSALSLLSLFVFCSFL